MNATADTLVLGWGNPARGDDGLGPALIEALAEMELPGVATDTDFQLQVEDAAEVARYRRVIFVDADRAGREPFSWRRLEPAKQKINFSTHSVAPAAVLALAAELFQARPEAWLLGVRGYRFDEFEEQLSGRASKNLEAATEFLRTTVQADNTALEAEGMPCKTEST